MRCPRCGQDTVKVVAHADEAGHEPECPPIHDYCSNCDYGLCCGEC